MGKLKGICEGPRRDAKIFDPIGPQELSQFREDGLSLAFHMRRNPQKAELFEEYCARALGSDDEGWDRIKDEMWARLQSFFRPALHRDIVYTLKVFLGTARWYRAHGIGQFAQYTDLVNAAELTKLDLDPVFLLDVSRAMDVWAGHQLTQVQHLVVASAKYEKTFDVPVWGSRKSGILEGSGVRFKGDVFRNDIPRFAVKSWKAFLPLNRAYESHSSVLTGSAELGGLSFLNCRISDFLRILRSARFEFLVKDPHSIKSPGLCMYAILTGIAEEDTKSWLPLEGSTLIRIRLTDSSAEEVSFYLNPEDYSGLATLSGHTSLQHTALAVLAKCRLSKNVFDSSPEVVPVRIWMIDESERATDESIARIRVRLTVPGNALNLKAAVKAGCAILEKNRFQYTPIHGNIDDILTSNPVFKRIAEGALFEELTQDLREVATIIQHPISLSVPEQEMLLSLELVLRAFYPNKITEDRIADWASLLISDWSLETPMARQALLQRYLQKTLSTSSIVRHIDGKWTIAKCSKAKESALSDDALSKYLILLVSISSSIRLDTLVKKAIQTLGLAKGYATHLEELITILTEDGRLSLIEKNALRLAGKLPEDIYVEDRNEEIDRLLMNLLRERSSTYEAKEELHNVLVKKIPDLRGEELDELIQQHLQAGDIVSDFDQLYAIGISPQASIERRERYAKKHFPTKVPAASPDEIRAAILRILHASAPNKIRFRTLCDGVMTAVRGSTRVEVSRVLHGLCNEQLVLVDKLARFVENPNPPKWEKGSRTEEEEAYTSPIILREKEVLMLPTFARAHQSGIIYANGRRRGTYKVFVKSFQESQAILAKLLTQVSNGDIISLKFEDHLGSQVMVWSENGVLAASYYGSPIAIGRLLDALSR